MGGSRKPIAALFVVTATSAAAAWAQGAPEPIAVEYDAPAECPAKSVFFDEVTARTSRARAAAPGESARVMRVRIEAPGGVFSGWLWIDDAGVSSTPRKVSGVTCGEVVGALGLVGALAVDPRASAAPRAAPGAGGGGASVPASASASVPASASASVPASASASASASAPPRTEMGRWGIGGGGEISGLAGAVFGIRAFVDAEIGDGIVAPAFRLAGARSLFVEREASVGAARLAWTTGALDMCPVRVPFGTRVALRPCIEASAGLLEAEGSGVQSAQDRARPWAAAGAHLRLVWAPARSFALELEGGASAPLVRETFFFQPDVDVYKAPPIAGFGRVGASVRFP